MRDILSSFKKALRRFEEALSLPKTDVNRDASIKRFEFTFELAWKTAQKFLRSQGIITRSPKETFQQSFKFSLIRDNVNWIRMLDDRNLTSHTYDEQTAKTIYSRLPQYAKLFEELNAALTRNGK